ncbi:hypothetical protein EAH78_13860 [Pseudomonas arsenicoxydans]|uniref:Carrier domain-containing protein n=1 Tax=Pseudomonas arsenicoxydans TaxID=702115 RepID=A0A502HTQ7_9PSED|nr:hypothetical protein EAH78_13860 [Pseudomonas arsenicoxydans]
MRLLIQLLHEELGLPERKTISLTTSIYLDLGGDGGDAQHLMETLEEQFSIDFMKATNTTHKCHYSAYLWQIQVE